MELTLDQVRQAELWRTAARERLARAEDELREAVAGMPASVERIRATRALGDVLAAKRECVLGLAWAQRERARIEGL